LGRNRFAVQRICGHFRTNVGSAKYVIAVSTVYFSAATTDRDWKPLERFLNQKRGRTPG
jgi:hypothetical protein